MRINLYTDNKGHFAIGKNGDDIFMYADVEGQLYGKFIDTKEIDNNTFINDEFCMSWIDELIQADIVDESTLRINYVEV